MKILLFSVLYATSVYAWLIPTLIGGKPADPKDWPASVYASMSGARCSATVIGERVLLIAAHCVSNGGTASFSVGANNYTSKCTHSPYYKNNATSDWALCVTNNKVTGIPYENVNQDEELFQVGDKLMLTGYGCIRAGGGGGNDGTYRIGEAVVRQKPSGTDNDIVTNSGAALCFGDSGGPAFFINSENKRWVVSVNSRGNISTTSYLSAVHTEQAKTFMKSWITTNSQDICGISEKAVGCRDVKPPGKEFVIETEVVSLKGMVKNDFLDFYDNIVNVLKEFLGEFK